MSSEIWNPSEVDTYKGKVAYIRYAAGLAILNDPDKLQPLYRRDMSDGADTDEVLGHAKSLIWAGLSDIIRYANPPEMRRPFANTEDRYHQALPHMIKTVVDSVETERERLDQLNPLIPIIQPLPLTSELIYKHVVHPRKAKVYVSQVMDAFTIDPRFGENAGSQSFENMPGASLAQREA
jgi:hypothetical protein